MPADESQPTPSEPAATPSDASPESAADPAGDDEQKQPEGESASSDAPADTASGDDEPDAGADDAQPGDDDPQPDGDKPDGDKPDSDNSDSDNPDSDNPDSDNSDSSEEAGTDPPAGTTEADPTDPAAPESANRPLDTFAEDMASGKSSRKPASFLPDRPRLELQTESDDFTDEQVPAVFVLDGERHTLGRRSRCDFIIRQSVVSGEHCEFFLAEGRWRVKDLGSTNGVRVNGTRVESTELKPGDILNFDTLTYIFVDPTRPIVESKDSRLVVLSGDVGSQVVPLGPTITIGRREGNTLVVQDDSAVSSHHARIERDETSERFRITDLGSRNGTKVDGKAITAHEPVELLNGSKIQVGKLVLRVVDLNAPDSPVEQAASTARAKSMAGRRPSEVETMAGAGDPGAKTADEAETDEVRAVKRDPDSGDGSSAAEETSDDHEADAARGAGTSGSDRAAAFGIRPAQRVGDAPVAQKSRIKVASEGAEPRIPGQRRVVRKTVRDYGKQFGLMWAVVLVMSLMVVLVFRIATAAQSNVGWPGGFGANFLIFLPLLQAVITLLVIFRADRHTRGPLLILVAVAPWLYAGNMDVNEYSDVYEQVPTSFFNLGGGDAGASSADDGFLSDSPEPLVQWATGVPLTNSGVLLFPVIALMLLALAPGLGVAVARQYFPRRPGLAKLNVFSVAGVGLLFAGIAVIAAVDPNTGASLKRSILTFPFLIVLVFPAAALVLFLLDWMKPSPGTNQLVRRSIQGFLLLVFLWWTFTGVVTSLQWFEDNPDGVRDRTHTVAVGGRVVGQGEDAVLNVPEGETEFTERTVTIKDTPGSAMARSIQHTFALFMLLFATIGLIVCGIVDMITSKVLPDDTLPVDGSGGPGASASDRSPAAQT